MSGRLQVIECADDTTGRRLFAVYDGLAVLRFCTTHEQSLVYVQSLLSESRQIERHGRLSGEGPYNELKGTAQW